VEILIALHSRKPDYYYWQNYIIPKEGMNGIIDDCIKTQKVISSQMYLLIDFYLINEISKAQFYNVYIMYSSLISEAYKCNNITKCRNLLKIKQKYITCQGEFPIITGLHKYIPAITDIYILPTKLALFKSIPSIQTDFEFCILFSSRTTLF